MRRTNINILIWIFTGVVGAHAGHFIYQKFYARDPAVIKVSESIAMVFGKLLNLLLQFLNRVIPLLIASEQIILAVIVLLVLTAILFVWFKIYSKTKTEKYSAKINEAENIVAAAQKKAAGEMQKFEELKKEMTAEFEKRESALQQESSEKMQEYTVKIKKLEKERLELKEMNGSLMRKLKTT